MTLGIGLMMFPALMVAIFMGFPVAFSLMGIAVIFGYYRFGDALVHQLVAKTNTDNGHVWRCTRDKRPQAVEPVSLVADAVRTSGDEPSRALIAASRQVAFVGFVTHKRQIVVRQR